MAWSTPDISKVSNALKDLLTKAVTDSVGPPLAIPHFNVTVSLASPETARDAPPCQLSLYLLHVGRDPYWRNSPTDGVRPRLNDVQPLSLNLYYLLTAWADVDVTSEQQAMTIALQCFYSQPIYRLQTTNDEFSITVEADTIEEMSRLWQAFGVAMRLSCVVKVGVVFITPQALPPPLARPPVSANLAVGPTPATGDPVALYGAMNLAFAPYPPPADADRQRVSGGELVAVASGVNGNANVQVRGAGLDRPTAAQVFLSTADGATEWRLAPAWRPAATDPGVLALTLPAAYATGLPGTATPLAVMPPAGLYRVAVGRNTPAPKLRSNAVPFVVAARVDGLTGPASGEYTAAGAGFVPGSTTVLCGTIDVTAAATVTAGTIVFPVPAGPPGDYPLHIAVNGVPCLPGPMVTL